jgi:hypothetical protein
LPRGSYVPPNTTPRQDNHKTETTKTKTRQDKASTKPRPRPRPKTKTKQYTHLVVSVQSGFAIHAEHLQLIKYTSCHPFTHTPAKKDSIVVRVEVGELKIYISLLLSLYTHTGRERQRQHSLRMRVGGIPVNEGVFRLSCLVSSRSFEHGLLMICRKIRSGN